MVYLAQMTVFLIGGAVHKWQGKRMLLYCLEALSFGMCFAVA
jgi:hypothetical protein